MATATIPATWADGQITTSTTIGTTPTVDAAILGGVLAVHPSLMDAWPTGISQWADLWTVSHAPTGLSVLTYLRSEAKARVAAEKLLALPLDWAHYREPLGRAGFLALEPRVQKRIEAIRREAQR